MTINNILTHFQNAKRAALPPWEPDYRGKSTELREGRERGAHSSSSQLAALGFIFLIWKMVCVISKICSMIPCRLMSSFLPLVEKVYLLKATAMSPSAGWLTCHKCQQKILIFSMSKSSAFRIYKPPTKCWPIKKSNLYFKCLLLSSFYHGLSLYI